jgi:antitoxin HicB
MYSASYPARFLREKNGKGFHVRFADLPEALTGGEDFEDTLVQASGCLAEAIAGRVTRGDEIPPPSAMKRGQQLIGVPRTSLRSWRSIWRCGNAGYETRNWLSG